MYAGRQEHRHGASLLEVLIATSILLMAVAALSTQASVGTRAANRTRLQGLAIAICQSALDEQIASGMLRSSPAKPASGFRDWVVHTSLEPLNDRLALLVGEGHEQLFLLSVTVWQPGPNEIHSRASLTQVVRKAQATLKSAEITPGVS